MTKIPLSFFHIYGSYALDLWLLGGRWGIAVPHLFRSKFAFNPRFFFWANAFNPRLIKQKLSLGTQENPKALLYKGHYSNTKHFLPTPYDSLLLSSRVWCVKTWLITPNLNMIPSQAAFAQVSNFVVLGQNFGIDQEYSSGFCWGFCRKDSIFLSHFLRKIHMRYVLFVHIGLFPSWSERKRSNLSLQV